MILIDLGLQPPEDRHWGRMILPTAGRKGRFTKWLLVSAFVIAVPERNPA
jgi:hypothetical protein